VRNVKALAMRSPKAKPRLQAPTSSAWRSPHHGPGVKVEPHAARLRSLRSNENRAESGDRFRPCF